MQEDFTNTFRLFILVIMVVALIAIIPNLLIISNEFLESGKSTLKKATIELAKEEIAKEEIKGIAVHEDGSVTLVKGPQKKAVVEELSLSLIIDHVLGDYTKEELREWGNSYTPSQWFRWAISFSFKIVIIGFLLLLVAPTLGSYLIYRFCKSRDNVGGIVDADWREENVNNCDGDTGFRQD